MSDKKDFEKKNPHREIGGDCLNEKVNANISCKKSKFDCV
jgi:hypothetical protein